MTQLAATLLALLSVGCATHSPQCDRVLFMSGHVAGMMHALEIADQHAGATQLLATRDQVDRAVAHCGWDPIEWRYDEMLPGVE